MAQTKEKRPKISVFIATSIDGYIAKKDGSVDWLYQSSTTGEEYGYEDFFSSIDALILGRKSYEKVLTLGEWPYQNKRVIVLSTTLPSNIMQYNTELYKGNITALVSKLYSEGIKHIYIDGGLTIRKFLKEKIVDQIILSFIPVILGEGIPLFKKNIPETWCKLISTKSYKSGLVTLYYRLNNM